MAGRLVTPLSLLWLDMFDLPLRPRNNALDVRLRGLPLLVLEVLRSTIESWKASLLTSTVGLVGVLTTRRTLGSRSVVSQSPSVRILRSACQSSVSTSQGFRASQRTVGVAQLCSQGNADCCIKACLHIFLFLFLLASAQCWFRTKTESAPRRPAGPQRPTSFRYRCAAKDKALFLDTKHLLLADQHFEA